MKSIKSKFLALTISSVIITAAAAGIIGFIFANNILKTETDERMGINAELQAQCVYSKILEIEDTCRAIESVLYNEFPEDINVLIEDERELNKYVTKTEELALTIAGKNCDDCILYYRFNPEIFSPTAGFYVQRQSKMAEFTDLPITDFSKFTPNDTDYVGWYYVPMGKGEPTWMDVYDNPMTGQRLLSYIIPIYRDGYEIGVIGMDLSIEVLDDVINRFDAYNNGFAFLLSKEGEVICHSKQESDFTQEDLDEVTAGLVKSFDFKSFDGKTVKCKNGQYSYLVRAEVLENGMIVVIAVPTEEVLSHIRNLPVYILGLTLMIAAIVIVITATFADKIITPLRQLIKASDKIAQGDYSTEIIITGDDEVSQLARALRHTSMELNKYVGYINRRAYHDSLTGLKNKTAYTEFVDEAMMHSEDPNFAMTIFVMDVNNLKQVNDQMGHEMGDMLLLDAANLIKLSFGEDFSFRIGGDEFVAFLMNGDESLKQKLVKNFRSEMKSFNQAAHLYKEELIIAIGSATFHEGDTLDSLFARADSKMYANKKRLKSEAGDK